MMEDTARFINNECKTKKRRNFENPITLRRAVEVNHLLVYLWL